MITWSKRGRAFFETAPEPANISQKVPEAQVQDWIMSIIQFVKLDLLPMYLRLSISIVGIIVNSGYIERYLEPYVTLASAAFNVSNAISGWEIDSTMRSLSLCIMRGFLHIHIIAQECVFVPVWATVFHSLFC